MTERTRVELPPGVAGDFEVYVNGVRQQERVDFRTEPGALVFDRPLAREGRLGPIRWLSMFLGVAGAKPPLPAAAAPARTSARAAPTASKATPAGRRTGRSL